MEPTPNAPYQFFFATDKHKIRISAVLVFLCYQQTMASDGGVDPQGAINPSLSFQDWFAGRCNSSEINGG
jgi:hypothetical protein